jgi:hypothetical protein
MTYKQLFKLEDFLNNNLCTFTHVELEEETTFEDAFGKSHTCFWNNVMMQGLFILVFAESNRDAIVLYNTMVVELSDILKSTSCFLDTDENDNLRLIIGVSETEK